MARGALGGLLGGGTGAAWGGRTGGVIGSLAGGAAAGFGGKKKGEEKVANIIDITGRLPQPMDKRAQPESDDDFAVVMPDGSRHYPINTWDLMKTASDYFEENRLRMQPEIRRQFATKLAARGSLTGYPVSEEVRELGSPTYASSGHVKAAVEMRKVACAPGEMREFLDELFEKKASLEPEVFAQVLQRFDVDSGLDKGWDQVVIDPWASTFGIDKTANVVWEQGAERVTDAELENLARNHSVVLHSQYEDDFVREFQKNPITIFNSMPDPQKRQLARMANDSSAQGGSEFMATRSPEGKAGGAQK
jgi:hypothetical protein